MSSFHVCSYKSRTAERKCLETPELYVFLLCFAGVIQSNIRVVGKTLEANFTLHFAWIRIVVHPHVYGDRTYPEPFIDFLTVTTGRYSEITQGQSIPLYIQRAYLKKTLPPGAVSLRLDCSL